MLKKMGHEQKNWDTGDITRVLSSDTLLVDHPELKTEEVDALLMRIVDIRQRILEDLEVDGKLDGPANIILDLIAVEMESTDRLEKDVSERRRVALSDAALVLFGQLSAVNRRRSESNLDPDGKYIETGVEDPQAEFFITCINPDLSIRFKEFLFNNELFVEQCDKLGMRPEFDVEVLDILQRPEETDEFDQIGVPRQDPVAVRSSANSQSYADNLQQEYGSVPRAWVRIASDGSSTLVLRSSHALRLLDQQDHDPDGQNSRALANLRHEISHTTKRFLFGASVQFGKLIEERKAEALSGDKAEYFDILRTFKAVEVMSGVQLTETLVDYVKRGEPVMDYLGYISEHLGPRFTLMLMMSSPVGAYDNPSDQVTAIDVEAFFEQGDDSCCDMLFRLIETSHGSAKYIEDIIRSHADNIVADDLPIQDGFVAMLRSNGLSRIATLYNQEFDRLATNKAARGIVGLDK